MTQLLQNAVCGTALILAAALLRRVLKDRLVPGARLALWAVCLFRLLTPAAPESVLSLWGLFASFAPVSQPSGPAYDTMSYLPPAAETFVPQIAEPGTSPDLYLKLSPFPWETVLLAVWLAVGVALAVRYVLSWRRTRRAVARAIPVDRDDPRYASLPKCARLREGPMEGAPLTFGVARPTVVLSPGLEGEALGCVLAHEGVHASRRDNLWHYVTAAALIVHWWNPAVWLMARLLRRDIELSCDRAALKKLGADRRAEYASALVSLATLEDGPAFCQTFGRKAAEERVLSVMKFKKTSVIGVVLSLALVLAVTVAFASEPKEPKELDAPDTLVVDGVTLTGDAARYASQLHAGMTRDEVHQLLGEPHNFLSGLYGDTYFLERLQDLPVTEPAAEAPLFIIYYDYEDFNSGVSKVERVIYRVGNGEYVVLIQSDQPTYVNPDEKAYDNYDSVKVGENDYDVRLPSFDEDGSPVSADGGIVGSTRYSLCLDADCGVTGSHAHINGLVVYAGDQDPDIDFPDDAIGGADSATGIYTAGPVPSAEPAKAFDDYTIVGMDENGYPVDEQGNSLVFDDNGNLFMKVRSGYGPCIKTDCTVSGEHHHANGEVVYHHDTLPAQTAESVSAGHHGDGGHHGNGHH